MGIWRSLMGLTAPRSPAPFTSRPVAPWGGWDPNSLAVLGYPPPPSTFMPVTEQSVMGVPAASMCHNLIVDGCGSLPMYGYTLAGDGSEARLDPTPDVLRDPWPMIPRHNWVAGVVSSMILRGNAYALPADFDPATGYPRQLPLLNPDAVWVDVDEYTGLPVYDVGGVRFGPGEIVHIPGLQPPGSPVGVGVIEAHRRQFTGMLALDEYGTQSFAGAGVPSGVVTVDRPELGQEQADDLKARWMAAFSGVREPAVVPRAITFQPLSFSPQDMAYVNARQQGAAEVCWMFGVHPNVIGAPAGNTMTYQNVEAAQTAFARMSLVPWTARIEQVLSKWAPRTFNVRFEYGGLLRGTTAERLAAYEVGLRIGAYTLNEVRDLEHLPRYDAWADDPFTQGPPAEAAPGELLLIPEREVAS